MGKLIDYFISKSLLVNLLTVLIVFAGGFSIYSLNKETFPNVDFELIIVRTVYPGSSAEDVEKLVSLPIERELKSVEGIDDLNILSGEGFSLAVLKIDPTYDVDKTLQSVRDAVSKVNNFPEDVDSPVITKIENKTRPIMRISLSGGENEKNLKRNAESLRDKLERLKEISKIEIEGAREYQYLIEADLNKLKKYDLSLAELSSAIADRSVNLSAGTLKTKNSNIVLRTFNEFESVDDILGIVIRSNSSGAGVRVKNVAKVSLTFKDRKYLRRVMAKSAIILQVISKSDADILDTTKKVKEITESYLSSKNDLNFSYINESAFFVKRRLGVLTSNGITGMVLVFICLLLFLNFRVSLVTSMGAPIAFMVAFILMESLGISINLISMFGLILVLGMLVDDSIIVAENFYQYLEKGMSPKHAAKVAAKETLAPVTATILTTMVAFSSLFFMGGIMGKFLWPVPAVVVICLLASWVECFFFLPSHLADFVRLKKVERKRKWYDTWKDFYSKILGSFLRNNILTVIGFILLFVASVFLAKSMRFELFPDDDVRTVYVKIKGEVGMPFEKTLEATSLVEKKIFNTLKKNEYENITSVVGSQRGGIGNTRIGDHYAMVYMYLSTSDKRDRNVDQLISVISEETKNFLGPNFSLAIERANTGPPRGKPINVELSGESISEILKVSKKVNKEVSKIKGVLTTEIDFEEGKKQLVLDINEKEARRLGLTNKAIALELRRAFEGQVVTQVRKSTEDIDVVVRLDDKYRKDKDTLIKLEIPNRFGRKISLSKFAELKESELPFFIRRYQRKRTISVTGDLDKEILTPVAASKEIEKIMPGILKQHPGISYELSGENKDTKESTMRLARAGIISLFLIFIILVTMFNSLGQPLIIMSSIPFGLIGVIWSFFIFGLPLGFMALMGVIGLIGVVVNDSIVLVSFINKQIKVLPQREAILEACVSRFRPVLLTTFTTVAGLLPIAHMPGGDPFLKPMAISFAYGLIFSTAITLIFVPCCYLIYSNLLKQS